MSTTHTLQEIRDFKGKYPKQLWYLFGTEMWERFCFYGMRGVLTIFMAGQLGLLDKQANERYGAIQAFVYAFTFIGGIFADKVLGFKRSLTFGALVMIAGNLIIAASPKEFFYIGITLSIIGTGFFKPNISSMVGQLYHEHDARRDAGYGLFYAGINVGALMGGALMVYLGKYVSWSYCFLAAAIVMTLGLITFQFTKASMGPIGDSPLLGQLPSKRKLKEMLVYVGSLLTIPIILILVQNSELTDYFMYTIAVLAIGYFIYEMVQLKDRVVRNRFVAAFIFIFFYFVFNAIFEQSGGSLSLFAEKNLSDSLLFFHIDPNIVNNASNSLFVIVLSPLIGFLWIWMAARKIEPSTIQKFGIGFVFLAASFYIFYLTRFFADANGITSLNVFTAAYFVTTIGELCLGPIGMSIVTKLVPVRLTGMMMGMWFLSSAFGQFAAGKLGAAMSLENASLPEKLIAYTDGYKELAIYALVAGVVLIVSARAVRRLMHGVH
ncbi:MAG: peptide MFS transporter [Flavobacteriales bacterium]